MTDYQRGRQDAIPANADVRRALRLTSEDLVNGTLRYQKCDYWRGVRDEILNSANENLRGM